MYSKIGEWPIFGGQTQRLLEKGDRINRTAIAPRHRPSPARSRPAPRPAAPARHRPRPPATARKNGGDRPRVLRPHKRGVWPLVLLHPRRPQAQGRLMRLGAAHAQQGARPPPARTRAGAPSPAVVDLRLPTTRPCLRSQEWCEIARRMLASLPRQRAAQRSAVAVGERPGRPGRPGLRRSRAQTGLQLLLPVAP